MTPSLRQAIGLLSLGTNVISATPVANPSLSALGALSAASATARLAVAASRLTFAGNPLRPVRRAEISGVNLQAAAMPVDDVNGVGEIRSAQLATMGIRTVGDLARVSPGELVRRLEYRQDLAEHLVANATSLAKGQASS